METNNKTIVMCDECGKDFEIKEIKTHDFSVGKITYRATYFRCPFCLHTYTFCIDNAKTLRMKNINRRKGSLKPTKEIKKEYEVIERAMKLFGVDKTHIDKTEKR